MKVKELLAILKAETEGDPSILENDFVVAIKYEGDQYEHELIPVKDVASGMDFTQSKTGVYPTELLTKEERCRKTKK